MARRPQAMWVAAASAATWVASAAMRREMRCRQEAQTLAASKEEVVVVMGSEVVGNSEPGEGEVRAVAQAQ